MLNHMVSMATHNTFIKNGCMYTFKKTNILSATHYRIQNLISNKCYGIKNLSDGAMICKSSNLDIH